MNGRVWVVGSVNMDIVAYCSKAPKAGETVHGDTLSFFPGGKGANQAIAAAKSGVETFLFGAVGKDSFGDRLRVHLNDNNVDTSGVKSLSEYPTGTAIITVESSGQNRIVIIPGANGQVRLSSQDIETATSSIVALAQFETNIDAIVSLFSAVRKNGGLTLLNPSPFCPVPAELEAVTSGLIVNEVEFARLYGKTSSDMAEQLCTIDTPFPLIVLTLGERGCLIRDAQGSVTNLQGHKVAVVDTTGAGDCFTGVFAAGLAQGLSLCDAGTRANAAAAISVTKRGAGTSSPSLAEIDRLLQAQTPFFQPTGKHHA